MLKIQILQGECILLETAPLLAIYVVVFTMNQYYTITKGIVQRPPLNITADLTLTG